MTSLALLLQDNGILSQTVLFKLYKKKKYSCYRGQATELKQSYTK